MAYACPVCAEPQVDAEHLANHVAFTAITGDDAHEAWLDSTVEQWGQLGQAELADIVVDHAEETEFPVDVDATDVGGHDHAHGGGPDHAHGSEHEQGPASAVDPGDLDEDTQDVLAEAREMTRRMQEGDDVDPSDEGSDGVSDDGANDDGTAEDERADSADVDSTDSETQ